MKISRKQFFKHALAGIAGLTAVAMEKKVVEAKGIKPKEQWEAHLGKLCLEDIKVGQTVSKFQLANMTRTAKFKNDLVQIPAIYIDDREIILKGTPPHELYVITSAYNAQKYWFHNVNNSEWWELKLIGVNYDRLT